MVYIPGLGESSYPGGQAGIPGPTGPAGATGATGPAGANGTNGTNGTNGSNGSNGADGKTVRSGSGAPSGGLGVDGDFYINTAANTIYGPKTSGSWGSPTSLVGPTGATGSTGASGVNGYGVRTADGRLTTVTGTPVLTSTQSAKTTLYYTPFVGNQIALYSGGAWSVLTFAETSLSLSGYTASKNYDIWGYNNSGTLALESTVWTNDTTRATALTTQDGVYCKSGDTTRRYLGTVRINSTGGQIDWVIGGSGSGGVEAKVTIWNETNRILQSFFILETATSWTHSNNSTWSSMNASTNNRISFIIGRSIENIEASVFSRASAAASTAGAIAFGLDSTSSIISTQIIQPTPNSSVLANTMGQIDSQIAVGHHYLQALDYSAGGISTFYGSQSPYTQSGIVAKGWF